MAATGFAGALTVQCQLLCRCSAGNFGIVTRFKVATVAVPAQVTVITAIWGFSAAVKAIQWYNVRAPRVWHLVAVRAGMLLSVILLM
jgi:FAD/FMN-containing dehydrogenase